MFEQKEIEMIKYLVKYVALPLSLVLVIAGCGGSDSDSEIVLGETYDEKPGDVFISSLVFDGAYSNGHTYKNNFVYVETYSLTSEIPSKYGYSNSIGGPYLLKTINEGGVLDSLEYKAASGESIIDDALDYYTNIEYRNSTGDEDPENVSIGDKFNFYENAVLFDSQTGSDIGYMITDINFSFLNAEMITVPAGEFSAVKIEYSISETTTKNSITDVYNGTGYLWLDVDNGNSLQLIQEGDMTLNEYGLTVTFTAKRTLDSYYISPNEGAKNSAEAKIREVPSSINLNVAVIFNSVKKSILKIRSKKLLH